jgi:predicted SnoaL-like aldol condensation-catalyzing enzyme
MARYLLPLAVASLALASCSAKDSAPSASDDGTATARAAITDYARLLMIEHKPEDAFGKYYADLLIQHDPWIGDGGKGDVEFLKKRREENPDKYDSTDQYISVIHNILADGNLVAIKSHVFTSPQDHGREFVDIWRMENGKFAEHWDIIQPIAADYAATVGCGVGGTYEAAKAAGDTSAKPVCGGSDPKADKAANKKLVLDYMAMGYQPGKLEQAINTYLAENFVQHSGHIPPGRQGLIDYMKPKMAERAADHRTSKIERVIADGDLVLVHRLVTSDSDKRGAAYIDVFRVKNGKITDHWDIVQPTPVFSASGRSMTGGPDTPLELGREHRLPRADEN